MRINKIFLLLFNIHSDTPQSCSKLSLILLLTHIIPTFALTHTFRVLIIPSLPPCDTSFNLLSPHHSHLGPHHNPLALIITSLALIITILALIITSRTLIITFWPSS